MIRVVIITVAILAVCSSGATALESRASVGMVKSASGEAYVVRDGRRLAAIAGQELVQGDRLSTGDNGSLGILMRDDTAISFGPSTEATLERFTFEPAQHKLGMVLRVARGIFGYLSGKIAKLAPGSVHIETPVATLGVRGTYFIARIVP